MTTMETILAEVEVLKTEHEKFTNKGVKAAATRTRKSAQVLIKALRTLRTEVQEAKKELTK